MVQYYNTEKKEIYIVYITLITASDRVKRWERKKVLKPSNSDGSLSPKSLTVQSLSKWKVKR